MGCYHYTMSDQLLTLYHSIFASHMNYGCQVWGHSPSNTYVDKIQVLQNNALRLITFAPDFRDRVTPIYNELKLLKIKDLITLKLYCLFMTSSTKDFLIALKITLY